MPGGGGGQWFGSTAANRVLVRARALCGGSCVPLTLPDAPTLRPCPKTCFSGLPTGEGVFAGGNDPCENVHTVCDATKDTLHLTANCAAIVNTR
jgi:hypothetical protein